MIDEIYHNNVRYLGNLLGEIIREQEGDETFNLIENVRADTEKSGVVRPEVASTGRIGIDTWKTSIASIVNANFLSDIGHAPPECMDLNRLALPCPNC